MPKRTFPVDPFDGQIFIDAFRIKWVYRTKSASWTKVGVASDVPVARPPDHPDGPTNGLLSSKDKILLDSLEDKAGGFGLILKPGYFLTQESAADNVLTGNVKVVSESLDFECTTTSTWDGCDPVPTVKVGLSEQFLNSYALEIRGPEGPRGDKGEKGRDGRPGTGDGPPGDPGQDGLDAMEPHVFSGIEYEELDEIYDTAVVNLRLDAPAGVLEVTKAKMDVPDNDKPATRVTAVPVVRGVEFNSEDLSKWQLVAPSDDPASTVDLNMVKLPKGWVGPSDSPVPVIPVRLTDVVGAMIDHYKQMGHKQIAAWGKQLRDWAVSTDKAARDALHEIAIKLAECQFEAPLELCLGIEPKDCVAKGITGKSAMGITVVVVIIDESHPPYWPEGKDLWFDDLDEYRGFMDQHSDLFEGLWVEAWWLNDEQEIGPGQMARPGIIPIGEPVPPEFTIREMTGYSYSQSHLNQAWIDLKNQSGYDDADIDNIFVFLDRSGSMSNKAPGYAPFVDYLANHTQANIIEEEFGDERWMKIIHDVVGDVISGERTL